MNLVSQLLFAVVISSVTSTLLLFVWRMLRRGLMLINPKLINSMLQMVCATYFLPIGYVAILLSKHRWLKGIGSSWKLYFARTKHITVVACIIAFIWLIIGGLRILKCFIQNKLWCEKLEDNIPIEDELAAEVFRKICNELNIPEGKVSLQRNPLMESPMIVCARSPQVLLPEQDYTEEELELIFYHELSHFKHHDLKWKAFVAAITMLQGFNLFVYPLLSIVSFWSECMADVSALESSGNMDNVKWYFRKIESLMPEPTMQKKKDKYLFATLYRSDKTMLRRVEFVQNYRYARICSKQVSVGLLTIFFIASIMIAVEAGICMADIHKFVYRATENDSEIRIVRDDVAEHYSDGGNWILGQQLSDVQLKTIPKVDGSNCYCVNLYVGADKCWTTEYISLDAGQSIDISAGVSFIGLDYCLGILDENGDACYVQVDAAVSHVFKIKKSGKYRVFIKNNGDEPISYILVNYKLVDCE